MSEKIKNFRTKDQREFDRISEKAEKGHKDFEAMMAKKELKLKNTGKLSEEDIDEVLLGLGTITRNGRELEDALEKIKPGSKEEKRKIEKEIWDEEKKKFLEEEFGMKVIK